ncbi:MAG: diacylglycerol kinase family lipid kinase [Lachnospiraceae bacterium]|nr:diacylglycerol kinase family lipid kinase [Lachnospiraceae bacterium]
MYYFIVNPASKTGVGATYWERVKKVLDEKAVSYQVRFSKAAGQVEEIVHELTSKSVKDKVHLVILGGDGTMNEAIQGIKDFAKVVISYIPTGSSNDLARDMGIGKNPEEALNAILKAEKEIYMDMGLVHYDKAFLKGKEVQVPDRRFMVGCGIGFDAAVCEEVAKSKLKTVLNKLKLGKLVYLGIALKQIVQSEMVDCKIVLDDAKEFVFQKMFLTATMVHHYQGGGFNFCPNAETNDGMVDLCVASNVAKLKLLRILPTAYDGKHTRFKEITMLRAKKAVIEVKKPMWVQTDGEVKTQASKITVSDLGEKVHFIY